MFNNKKHGNRGRGRGNRKFDFQDGSAPSYSSIARNQQQNNQGGQTSRKFEEACAEIQANISKYVNSKGLNLEEDSDEDQETQQNNVAVLDKLVNSYKGGDQSDIGNTKHFVQDAIKSGGNICLVCIEIVKKTEPIWACEGCYCIFHLTCIQKWSNDSIYQQAYLEEKTTKEINFWFCPKCRHEFSKAKIPKWYLCFCGKETNPKFDPWLVPHSCGQICSKELTPTCGHKCLLLCHPGPCPPCPQMVQSSCFCKNEKPQTKRCSNREWSCGKICKQLLSCNQHTCSVKCHKGDCPSCPRESLQFCRCKKNKSKRLCAMADWQCEEVCKRKLSCGNHECDLICHSAFCGDCPRSGMRSCPCGKTSVILPCTSEVEPCGDTCGKMLECNIHRCSSRCHNGACGMCLQMRMKRCRCGSKDKSLPCYKEFLCEVKCKKLRDCGRHSCNRKCCDGNCPSCEQICGRTLRCKNHKCSSICHLGPCYPCPLTVDIKCYCGSESIRVPCGRENVTKPPICSQFCKLPTNCHHKENEPHKCHFGDCPPCKKICDKLMVCGHVCKVKCHAAVLTIITPKQVRAGPWEPQVASHCELVDQPCPPCNVPVPITCIGGHETCNYPCHLAKQSSCFRKCGRILECENHTCSLDCHAVINAKSVEKAGENCEVCERQCELPRITGCTHICLETCHPAPCAACTLPLKLQCHCKLYPVYVECAKWTTAKHKNVETTLCCKNQCPKQLSCGHRCSKLCHSGSCLNADMCTKKMTIRCPCHRLKKEMPCNLAQQNKSDFKCDDTCLKILDEERKVKESEEIKRKAEEIEKRAAEIEKYQRKLEGKKRKPRKKMEAVEEESMIVKYRMHILVAGLSLLISIILYMYL